MTISEPDPDPEPQRSRIRIGDAERHRALDRLSELTASGHLSVPEFEERSARVTRAHTHGELAELFLDLPTSPPNAIVAAESAAAPERSRKLVDDRKTAALSLGTLALVSTGIFVSPWLILLAPFMVLIVWVSGRGPSSMYRDEK